MSCLVRLHDEPVMMTDDDVSGRGLAADVLTKIRFTCGHFRLMRRGDQFHTVTE